MSSPIGVLGRNTPPPDKLDGQIINLQASGQFLFLPSLRRRRGGCPLVSGPSALLKRVGGLILFRWGDPVPERLRSSA